MFAAGLLSACWRGRGGQVDEAGSRVLEITEIQTRLLAAADAVVPFAIGDEGSPDREQRSSGGGISAFQGGGRERAEGGGDAGRGGRARHLALVGLGRSHRRGKPCARGLQRRRDGADRSVAASGGGAAQPGADHRDLPDGRLPSAFGVALPPRPWRQGPRARRHAGDGGGAGPSLPGGLQAIHTPGPERAHYALWRAEAPAVVFCPDLVMRVEGGEVEFVPPEYHEDPEATRDSLRRLLDLPFALFCMDHGAPLAVNGREALQKLSANR